MFWCARILFKFESSTIILVFSGFMLTYHHQVCQFLAKFSPVQNSSGKKFVKMKPLLRSNTLMRVPEAKRPKKPSLHFPVLQQKAVVPIFWSPCINTGNNQELAEMAHGAPTLGRSLAWLSQSEVFLIFS